MIGETIEPPHYYAGYQAVCVCGPWRMLSLGRMCHYAGYRRYRAGFLLTGKPIVEFKYSES